jgi:hypothetical protein
MTSFILEFIANTLDMFAQNLREIWIFETYQFFKLQAFKNNIFWKVYFLNEDLTI